MKLTYIYHSGFAFETTNVTLVFDFWKDPTNILPRLLHNDSSIYVFASHFHPDHFTSAILKWQEIRPDIHYLFSRDIMRKKKAAHTNAHWMTKGERYEDSLLSVDAMGSTDTGVSWSVKIHDVLLFHAGDLNNWSALLPPEEQEGHEKRFSDELNFIAEKNSHFDIVMFPIDDRLGTDYLKGASEFIHRFPTRFFAPMHFTASKNPASPLLFQQHCKKLGTTFLPLTSPGDSHIF